MIFFAFTNINRMLLVMVLATICLVQSPSAWALEQAAITSSLLLKVTDRDRVADLLSQKAEELNGWFFERTDDSIKLKVPTTEAKAFITYAENLGIVADRSYASDHLALDLSSRLSSLKSKEESLAQYLAVLESARKTAVLTVEREIVALTAEIEKLKGEIRFIRHRINYAQITITFEFRDRSAPVADGSSSFPWLNTMNISDLVRDFQYAHK